MENSDFPRGIPYALDVKRLREAFPENELTEGRIITHEMLEGALGIERGTQRYYGVINSWVTKTRNDTAIFMVWSQGDGLAVLPPDGVLGHAETRTRQKIRQTGRAIGTFAWVQRDRLDDTGKARLDHQRRIASALKTAMTQAKTDLAVELAPIASIPKRRQIA